MVRKPRFTLFATVAFSSIIGSCGAPNVETSTLDRVQGRASVVVIDDGVGNLSGWLITFQNPGAGDGVWFTLPSGIAALTVTTDTEHPVLEATRANWSSITFQDTRTRNSSVFDPTAGSWWLRFSGGMTGSTTIAVNLQREVRTASRLKPLERLLWGEAYADSRYPRVTRFVIEHASDIRDVAQEAINVAGARGSRGLAAASGFVRLVEGAAVEASANLFVRGYEDLNGCSRSRDSIYDRGLTDRQLLIANLPVFSQVRRVVTCRLDLSR